MRCHSYGMSYTIGMDAAGRVVLPKAVRERYGLADGPHQLEVSDTADGIVLRPKGEPVPLVRTASGWLVFQSGVDESIDPVAAIDEMRAQRSRVIRGEE